MQTLKPKSPLESLPTPAQLDEMIHTREVTLSTDWRATIGTFRNERTDCTNPKPNEDRAIVDPVSKTIAVADGITRTKRLDNSYPDPSPSAQLAERLCEAIPGLRQSHPIIHNTETLANLMTDANRAVAQFNQRVFPTYDFAERDRAGLAFILGVIEGDELWSASIADAWCAVFREGVATVVANEKTSQSRAEYKRLGEIPAREALRNRIGNPLAYGALTGEREALHFIEYNRVSLKDVDRVVFSTDGLLRVLQEDPAALATLTVQQIIHYGRVLDRIHDETDDKTIVMLERIPSRPR